MIDGRDPPALAPGERDADPLRARQGPLAQLPGSSYYHRLREKFGKLAY